MVDEWVCNGSQREREHTMKKLFLLLLLLLPLSLSAQTATINWTNVHQVIDGFGASDAFQGQGGGQGSTTSANQSLFFGTGGGQLGYSILRVCAPSGSASPYCSFDCNSVGSACAGPYVGDMQSVIAQGGKVMASSWTPPAQYNTNNSTTCSGNSGLASASYANYATWVTNFVKSLSAQSVSLYGFSVQNEPNDCGGNLAYLSAAGFDSFIGGYLGPTFASNSITTKIMLPDINYLDLSSWGGTCASDSTCNNYVGIRNFQDYDAYLSGTNTVTPDPLPGGWSTTQHYWETEASCPTTIYSWPYDPSFCPSSGLTNDITHALDWAAVIDQRLAGDGANAWLYWWLYCDSCADDEALSDGNGNVYKRGYVLAQYSKFVRPGDYRIDATRQPTTGVSVSAYQNTSSNYLAIIATNYTGSPVSQTFNITNAPTFTTLTPTITSASQGLTQLANIPVSGQSFTYTLPAQSVVTFVSTGSTPTNYSLTVTATNGTISGTNCATGTYVSGTSIGPCTFTPSGGYTFTSGWSGAGPCSSVSGTGTASCTLSSNATLSASGTGSSCGNYTASSDSESAVNSAINGPNHVACNGDTISIPCSGTQSVTWSSTLTVNASITLTALGGATPNTTPSTFGAATSCLTITAATGTLFQFNPTYSATNNVTTIQNMTLIPGSGAYTPIRANGTGTSSGMPLFRVDNIQFGNATAQWQYGTGSNTGEFDIIEDNTFGVADHNSMYTGSHNALISVNLTAYLGVGQYGDNSWAQPDSMGGTNNFFIENNNVYLGLWPIIENEQSYPSIGGSRAVVRFNETTQEGTFALNSFHGLDTDGRPRAGRHIEVYGNAMNCVNGPDGNQCYDLFIIRGGTGLFFDNQATVSGSGSPYWKEVDGISTLRAAGDGWSNNVTSAIPTPVGMGSCGDATSGNAQGAFDENDGVQYYSGTMGSGTSGTTIVDSGSPGWTTNQWLNAGSFVYYVWDVTQGWVTRVNSNSSNTLYVQQAAHGYINGGTFIAANSGDSYRIRRSRWCLDGAGVGQSALLQGLPPVLASTGLAGPANPTLDPFYEWDNSAPAITGGEQTSQAYSNSIANTTYYSDNSLGVPHVQTSPTSPFNGAATPNTTNAGVGWGTLANRPTTCTANPVSGTPGVGYFATDQGGWNISGNGFGQGELFKCTSTNTWTLGYTPYTYPHPLDH